MPLGGEPSTASNADLEREFLDRVVSKFIVWKSIRFGAPSHASAGELLCDGRPGTPGTIRVTSRVANSVSPYGLLDRRQPLQDFVSLVAAFRCGHQGLDSFD